MAPGLLATRFAIEDRVVAGAVQRPVFRVVPERKTLVRTYGREADNVSVRTDPALHGFAEFDQHARGISIGVSDLLGLV